MLTTDEIKMFIAEDDASAAKRSAREGERYYEGNHDILDYRMFYYNADGNLVEDKTRNNAKIPHPFFTELVDQAAQHIMSGDTAIFQTSDQKLQEKLDLYFNNNGQFKAELTETITGQQVKGFDYMHAYTKEGRLAFENADSLGVVEVEGRFAEDGKDQIIWKYVDRIDAEGHTQFKILVIDDQNTYYFQQEDDGTITEDETVEINPRPHRLYQQNGKLYTKDGYSMLPFFRLDCNKKRQSMLRAIKSLIDDYDLMASSLTNNLQDFDTPLHVVKGFQGDNLDELQQNLKTKKIIGTDEDGGVEVLTVEIPYEARIAKMEHDEKCIYKFGMGLNLSNLKDTSATTNIAIKAAYSLLELRCNKLMTQIEQFLEKILQAALDEINDQEETDYQRSQVVIRFEPEIMANATENAQIELTYAQTKQAEINTLLALQELLDNETLMRAICEQLDINYEEIKDQLPDGGEAYLGIGSAAQMLA